MPFDSRAFKATKFEDRTQGVPVPDLAAYFGEGEKPVWTVRQLSGFEVGQAKQAQVKRRNREALLTVLERDGATAQEASVAFAELSKLGPAYKSGDIGERLEWLVMASVEPTCDLDMALKLCKAKPTVFYDLTTRILQLTGLGMQEAKPDSSIKMTGSEPV